MVLGASIRGAARGSGVGQPVGEGSGAGGLGCATDTGTVYGGGGSVTTLGGGGSGTATGPAVGVGVACAPSTTSLGTSLNPRSSVLSGPPHAATSDSASSARGSRRLTTGSRVSDPGRGRRPAPAARAS